MTEGRMQVDQPIKNLGWRVTLAGVGINLALGVLYSWSIISKEITKEWKWTEADSNWPNAVALLTFSLLMVPAGRLQDKMGPRLAAGIGGLLVGCGMILASVSGSFWGYIVGFGVLAGAGIGFGYAAATPPAVKWFPAARTGMIAGLVVSGFGLASVYTAPLTKWLISTCGIANTMLYLGIAFLLVVVGLAQLLTAPPAGYVPAAASPASRASRTRSAGRSNNGVPVATAPVPAPTAAAKKRDFTPKEMLGTAQFYLLWFMYACGAGAGLMIISKLAKIGEKQAGITLGFVLVVSLAIGNGAGRILAGSMSDKLGRQRTMLICFLFQAVLMVLLTTAQEGTLLATIPALAVVSALIGANYGANLALFPSITKDYYGLKNFGVNYGLVFTAWGIGGFLLSQLQGALYDAYQTFSYSCYAAAGLLVLAAAMTFTVKAPAATSEPVESPKPEMAEA